MMTLIAAALALAAQADLPRPGPPVAWEQLVEDPGGRILIDPASIVRGSPTTLFHVWVVAAEGHAEGTATQAVMSIVLNCDQRTSGIQAVQTYDHAGRLLQTREFAPAELLLVPIADNSAEAAYHRRVCPAR